jgi:hypothetical protein
MHAERVTQGGSYQWCNYFEPEPELIEAFEKASSKPAAEWDKLEPEFFKS